MGNWSDLPPELLLIIAKSITIKDRVILKSVCTQWRTTLEEDNAPACPRYSNELPWLLLPLQYPSCNFYSLADDKFYQLEVPEAYEYRCWGSTSQGWLVMYGRNPSSVFMFNPLTRSRIDLPAITTFPQVLKRFVTDHNGKEYYRCFVDNLDAEVYAYSSRHMERYWLERVGVTGNPCLDYYTVLAIYGSGQRHLGFCKKGDDKWTYTGQSDVHDICYWNGGLYAVTPWKLLCFDSKNPLSSVNMKTVMDSKPHNPHQENYLVVSSDELLLLVRLYDSYSEEEFYDTAHHLELKKTYDIEFDDDEEINSGFDDDEGEDQVLDLSSDEDDEEDEIWESDYDTDEEGSKATTWFIVYKPDFDSQRWVRVRNIGDQALFVGINGAMSFRAQDFPGCKQNHIYFTPDVPKGNQHDLGEMDLETCMIKSFPGYSRFTKLFRPAPLWITPSLH